MVKDFKDNILIVKYQGVCGTCPDTHDSEMGAPPSHSPTQHFNSWSIYVRGECDCPEDRSETHG